MDKRDRFEELFRERLHDWECEPGAESWDTLSGVLPEQKVRFFPKSIGRIVAVFALLLLVGGSLLYVHYLPEMTSAPSLLASYTWKTTPSLPKQEVGNISPALVPDLSIPCDNRKNVAIGEIQNQKIPIRISNEPLPAKLAVSLGQSKHSLRQSVHSPVQRKWRIGMGGGSLNIAGITTGTGNYPEYTYNSDFQGPHPEDPDLLKSKASQTRRRSLLSELKPDKVKHSCPLSIGMGVSRSLSERWSFNTGITYSYLRNQWRYEGRDHDVLRQRLHMVGIPVSVSYRLADWKHFYCYCSAGFTCEFNITSKIFSAYKSQRQRLRGTLWTANARVGVAYPIIRYVSVYAEGGFLWNLTPESEIQTIRSEHFFNVTGQIGFRLNF